MDAANIPSVPAVAVSRTVLGCCAQDPPFLMCHKLFVSDLDGSGFGPGLPFHMTECVSVRDGDFLSHTIWKCQV